MSIDIRDTVATIREAVAVIDAGEDFLTIAAAEEHMSTTEIARKKELDEAHARLSTVSQTLSAAQTSSTRPSTVPSARQHAATLNRLDAQRMSLGKAINEAESSLASKEAELARLKEELHALEEEDPATDHDLDANVLRLQLYKGLGFEPILEKNGQVKRMLVRARSGDIHYLSLNDPDRTELESVQLAWKLASS